MLDPHGKPNTSTPQDWKVYYVSEGDNNIVKAKKVVEEVEEED